MKRIKVRSRWVDLVVKGRAKLVRPVEHAIEPRLQGNNEVPFQPIELFLRSDEVPDFSVGGRLQPAKQARVSLLIERMLAEALIEPGCLPHVHPVQVKRKAVQPCNLGVGVNTRSPWRDLRGDLGPEDASPGGPKRVHRLSHETKVRSSETGVKFSKTSLLF